MITIGFVLTIFASMMMLCTTDQFDTFGICMLGMESMFALHTNVLAIITALRVPHTCGLIAMETGDRDSIQSVQGLLFNTVFVQFRLFMVEINMTVSAMFGYMAFVLSFLTFSFEIIHERSLVRHF